MTRWLALLTLALVGPALAAEQKAEPKKAPPPPTGVSADDLIRQAEAKLAAGDSDGAAELLRKAAALPTGGGEAGLRLGRLLESRNQYDVAIDAYKAAAEKLTGPSKGEALGRLAIVESLRGMPEAAATTDAALAADAEGLWPTLAQARRLAREGKGEEAVALAEKAAGKGGGAAASVAKGAAHEATGALAAAEADYRAAAADAEQKIAASVGLARVLRKTGRAAEAEPLLARLLQEAPAAVDGYKESARVKMALGRPEEALGDAATAAALADTDPEAKRLQQEVGVAKALTWLRKNQADMAVQELTALRDQQPDQAPARVGLARAYAAKRQADLALAELTKALELDPASAEAHYQLGYVQHVLKRDAAAAVPAYEKAVAADPGNTEYRTALGAALLEAKQLDRATSELTRVTQTAGYKGAEAWIHLGGAHLAAKRYQEAIAALDKALAIAPDNAATEAYLAWSYFGLKDSKNFIAHGSKARTLGHKEPTLLAYLARVEKGEPIK